MQRSVFLSTFLFAAVLSPITLYGNDCAPPADARLAILELRVGSFHGENTIEGFDPNVFSYDARFPEEESVGILWVRTKHPSQSIEVQYDGMPVKLVGQSVAKLDVPLGSSELTIDVATRGPMPDSQRYVVRVERVPVFACTEQGIREAIARGGGPIYFDCDEPTVVPTEAEIVIDNDVILDGEGNLIVDAQGTVPPAPGEIAPKVNGAHRVFSIPEGVTAELLGFTVTGGSTDGDGGGILNAGTLTLAKGVVSGNTARFGGGVRNEGQGQADVIETTVSENFATQVGGGISNRLEGATMTLSRSTVQGNTATGNVGGIANSGTLTVNDTTVSGNEAGGEAGGIGNSGEMTMTKSTVFGNTATAEGGGILNAGAFSLENSTVSGNQAGDAGGGIVNEATMTLKETTISANEAGESGGGVDNRDDAELFMTDCVVSENTAADDGGGVRNGDSGTLALTRSTVSGNSAGRGGGVESLGALTLSDCTVAGNSASAGGGLHNAFPGSMTVANSTVSDNTATSFGGGIYNHNDAFAEVTNTNVSNNTAMASAGGISNRPGATMVLSGGIVDGNAALGTGAGGISNAGTLTMSQVRVSSNSAPEDGGGVFNSETGTLTATRCTVEGNAAGTWGGGIRNFGAANVMDTTVSHNTAQGGTGISNRPGAWMALTNSTVSGNGGSGISNWSTLTLASVTVSGNSIYNDGGWITARNTIVDSYCDATPLVDSLGGNIESPGNTCGLNPAGTDQVNVLALALNLGPLADNGGSTQTHALLPGSVAIDWIPVGECVNAAGFPLLVDQRGASRPSGPACDSGAFELGGVLLPRDQCINDADRTVYESLEYIDESGNFSTCTDAANSIAADCVFGSPQSSPPLVGCPGEVDAVIACFPNCSPDVIAALDQCVADCTEGATGLSTECAGCYGGWAGCGAQTCVPECAAGATQPSCTDCLFAAGCTGLFDACSGLPGDIDCGAGGVPGEEYTQNFESLDQMSPTALSDDGWLIFGQVVEANGDLKFDYGPFPAPNGTPGFSSIVAGEGGPDQGAQQLVVYNDYNCCSPDQGHFNGTDRVQSSVFQQPFTVDNPISADDVGKTLEFSFDAKRGDIAGSSTALAFIQTLDPGFAQTNFVQIDMTNFPADTWDRYSISLAIDAGLVGQYLEFGFLSTASSFEPSAVLYDNIRVVLEAP